MAIDITPFIQQLSGELDEKAYKASDSLGRIGTESVVDEMINLLNHPNPESRYLAVRTLGLIKHNEKALSPLLEAIQKEENKKMAGDFLAVLDGFDISDIYVELFRIYLFGNFRVSMLAKDLLDHEEFNISPRVLKKARKHWNHYSNNVKIDDAYELRKIEVEEMLNDLEEFIKDDVP